MQDQGYPVPAMPLLGSALAPPTRPHSLRRFVDALPAQSLLGEIAPMPAYETPHLSHEELQFLQQAFPDLNPSEVLANRDSVQPAFGR
jgi:hypothetical protein